MGSQQEMFEIARRTRRTLYTVASLYVAIGFIMALPAALNGDTTGAFLGFLIVSGALAVTVIIEGMLRLNVRLAATDDAVRKLSDRLNALPPPGTAPNLVASRTVADEPAQFVDLNESGASDPADLAAASLDNVIYPRLLTTADEEPVESNDWVATVSSARATPPTDGVRQPAARPASNGAGDATRKQLMRAWVAARRAGDLAACREIYDELADHAGIDLAELLREQLGEVTEQARLGLRDLFARQVRENRFAEALATGERLTQLFPESPLATEFQRLRPHLQRRLQPHTSPIDRAAADPPTPLGSQRTSP